MPLETPKQPNTITPFERLDGLEAILDEALMMLAEDDTPEMFLSRMNRANRVLSGLFSEDQVARHPIMRLYAEKMARVTGLDAAMTDFAVNYRHCCFLANQLFPLSESRRHALAHLEPWPQVVPTSTALDKLVEVMHDLPHQVPALLERIAYLAGKCDGEVIVSLGVHYWHYSFGFALYRRAQLNTPFLTGGIMWSGDRQQSPSVRPNVEPSTIWRIHT